MVETEEKTVIKKFFHLIKKETVLCVALLLALISSFIVPPDGRYLDYIDFRTLTILFCLMSVMAGLKKIGLFQWIAEGLLKRVKSMGQLVLILILLCFFFSMLITNDVALITFVPFTFTVMHYLGEEQKRKAVIPVVVMQTIAANLGSMLTPIGNPQNLYLYGKAGLAVGEFVILMLPYTLLALGLLLLWCVLFGISVQKSGCSAKNSESNSARNRKKNGVAENDTLHITFSEQTVWGEKKGSLIIYLILFVLCLLTVAHIIPYVAALFAVLVVIFFVDKKVFAQVDYSLLLTFVGFFVFIGNMGRISAFSTFLQSVVEGNEVVTSVVASQVISNVPAALLLSGFTTNYQALIVGTNLGGLGTLIASMASLISYKFVAKEDVGGKGKYLLYFTVANICFLILLVLLYILVN